MDDSIVSRHVRMRIPIERQWLGREAINDLENCWSFVNAATDARLPRWVTVVINTQNGSTGLDLDRGIITIGLADPTAAKDARGFLVHAAVREMARMVLLILSGGSAARPENRFLLEGMSEMLAHDYSNSVRKLTAAWAITYYLDRINPLGLKQLAAGNFLSESRHTLHTAAPGITFLTAASDFYGSQRVFRFFEALAKRDFGDAVSATFKTTAAALEEQWLARVRKYDPADITVTAEDGIPILDRITFAPDPGRAGASLSIRISASDGGLDLPAAGIFLVDEASGRVVNASPAGTAAQSHMQCELPITPDCKEGQYTIQVIAIDEAGNLRNWNATYTIKR
jgi:hypothetical protein